MNKVILKGRLTKTQSLMNAVRIRKHMRDFASQCQE